MICEGLFFPGRQRSREPIDFEHASFVGPGVERFEPFQGGAEVLGGADLAEKCSLAT